MINPSIGRVYGVSRRSTDEQPKRTLVDLVPSEEDMKKVTTFQRERGEVTGEWDPVEVMNVLKQRLEHRGITEPQFVRAVSGLHQGAGWTRENIVGLLSDVKFNGFWERDDRRDVGKWYTTDIGYKGSTGLQVSDEVWELE